MLTKTKPILREQKIREFIAETGLHFVSVILSSFEAVRSGDDVEALHDMRVATRRLGETLQLFADFYPPARLKKTLAKIRKVTRILGLPREMDVNCVLLQSHRPDGGLVLQTTHEHLLFWFETEQRRKKLKMLKAFNKFDLKAFEPDLRLFVQSVVPSRSRTHQLFEEHQSAELETFRHQIPGFILAKARPVLDFRVTDATLRDDDELHRLRIATKKLRYVLEILKPVQVAETGEPPIELCRTLQDILGDLHDRVALVEQIREHQADLADQGLLLLTHGCARLANEFSDEKEMLRPKIKPAHEQLTSALVDYLRRFEPAPPASQAVRTPA